MMPSVSTIWKDSAVRAWTNQLGLRSCLDPLSANEARHVWPRNGGNQASVALGQPLFRHLMQRTAIDLVGGRERQFIDEPDKARMLVGGRVGQRELLDALRIHGVAGLADDKGDRLLAFNCRAVAK
jgi:hypothetical protein